MDGDPFTGKTFAQYKIENKLGQGGMGAVYRAWDSNLHRWVAIKVLEATGDSSAEKRARFIMEARAASALNHPNIVTIFEIGQAGPIDYIVMELVPGRTLDSIVHGSQAPTLDEVLKYGVQIADALSAAHAAGITHRDLKPANILVTERGRVKVVDFGLAKRLDTASSDLTRTLLDQTQKGFAVGTLHYMSPEQAQGKTVDGRTDIFAIGAILYEMLTGQRAFQGDSMAAIMVAIMTQDPPPIANFRPVPEELDRLISRCLRKDVERRVQHADDLKIALEELRADYGGLATYSSRSWPVQSGSAPAVSSGAYRRSGSGSAEIPGQAPDSSAAPVAAPRKGAKAWIVLAAVLLLVGAAAGGWYLWKRQAAAAPFAPDSLTRLTTDEGLTGWPALSRDGKFLAYASDRGEDSNLHIWVQQLGGGSPIRLTSGDSDDIEPAFSADGTHIAFHSKREGGGIYLVSTLGGDPHLIAKNGRRPQFSPDGSRIVYWEGDDYGKVYIVPLDGGPPKVLQSGFASARYPVWAPDGQSILFEGLRKAEGEKDWWLAPLDDRPAIATGVLPHLRAQKISVQSGPAAWLANDDLLFSGGIDDVESVWKLRLVRASAKAEGAPQRLTFGTSLDSMPAASTGSLTETKVVFASMTRKIDLWSVPMSRQKVTGSAEMARLTHAGTQSNQLSISNDGRRIAYLSDRDGKARVWIRDLVSGKEVNVSSPEIMWAPNIGPDGTALAWSVFEKSRPTKTFVASIGPEGQLGAPDLLCQQCGPIISWAPDSRSVVYAKTAPSRAALLELDSHKTYDVLQNPPTDVWGGRFSPDGHWLAMNATPTPVQSQIFIARFDPERRGPIPVSEWIAVTDGKGWDDKPRWAPDSKGIYFVSHRDGFRCIWLQPLDPRTRQPAGAPTPVMHFHHARRSMSNVSIGPLSLAVARDRLIFSLGELTGNIWMFTPAQH